MRAFRGVMLGAFVGFLLAAVRLSPALAPPVFDIYWGPPNWILLYAYPSYTWSAFAFRMSMWWALLFFAAFTRRRKLAVTLYSIHVVGGPVARYVLEGEAPTYLLKIYHPALWLVWSPMVAFTVWYFTMVYGIRWREVARRIRSRWRAWHGGVER